MNKRQRKKHYNNFYKYLASQFSNLDEAKVFAAKFAKAWKQEIPGYGMFSCRSMAAHISRVLEGKEQEHVGFTWYLGEKYGSEIVWVIWDNL